MLSGLMTSLEIPQPDVRRFIRQLWFLVHIVYLRSEQDSTGFSLNPKILRLGKNKPHFLNKTSSIIKKIISKSGDATIKIWDYVG
jgi:hypothetical protein